MGTLSRVFAVAAFVLMLGSAASSVPSWRFELPAGMKALATAAEVDQPRPSLASEPAEDGWYVVEGVLLNGSRVDVWTGGRINYAKPPNLKKLYGDAKVRRYLMRLAKDDMVSYRTYYANFLCLKWNDRYTGDARLDQIYVNFIRPAPAASKTLLLHQACVTKKTGAT